MSSVSTTLERLININNVKYDLLYPMINRSFANSKSDVIDIYIDMNSILKVLYSSVPYTIEDYSAITSCFVGMIGHYRHFFRTRYRTHSRFYLIYSNNCPYLNNQFMKDYNSEMRNKIASNRKVSDMIANNLNMLKILCPYLPDIFFIESEFETGVVIYDLMCRQDPDNLNGHMIITKDQYNYQLVNMKPQTVVLRPKRNDGSYMIERHNLFEYFASERKINRISTLISPDLYSCILALVGIKDRNINSFINITKAINTLEGAILNRRIVNGYNTDLSFLFYGIADKEWKIGESFFVNRFKAIDIQFQHSVYVNTPEAMALNLCLVNNHDPETVKQINNEYFRANPLDLNRL